VHEKSFSAGQGLLAFGLYFKEKLAEPKTKIAGSYDASTPRWHFRSDLTPEQLVAAYGTMHSTGSPETPDDEEVPWAARRAVMLQVAVCHVSAVSAHRFHRDSVRRVRLPGKQRLTAAALARAAHWCAHHTGGGRACSEGTIRKSGAGRGGPCPSAEGVPMSQGLLVH
jgi:hypothetical protein